MLEQTIGQSRQRFQVVITEKIVESLVDGRFSGKIQRNFLHYYIRTVSFVVRVSFLNRVTNYTKKKIIKKCILQFLKMGGRNVSFPNYQILLCRFFSIIIDYIDYNRSDSFAMKLLVEFLVGTSMEIGRNS